MWVCSGKNSDSCPRSSASRAMSPGRIASWVGKIATPNSICIILAHATRRPARASGPRYLPRSSGLFGARDGRCLGPRRGAQLGEDVGNVNAGGLLADEEFLADLPVGQAAGHQAQDLAFPWGERRERARAVLNRVTAAAAVTAAVQAH